MIMKNKKRSIVNFGAFFCIAAVVAVLGVYMVNTGAISRVEPVTVSLDAPLVVVVNSGGMCADGVCYREAIIYKDGTIKGDSIEGTTSLTTSQTKTLNKLVEEWDPSVLQVDDNAFCQSYADGNDLGIKLPTSENPEELYNFCWYENSQSVPLFDFVSSLRI